MNLDTCVGEQKKKPHKQNGHWEVFLLGLMAYCCTLLRLGRDICGQSGLYGEIAPSLHLKNYIRLIFFHLSICGRIVIDIFEFLRENKSERRGEGTGLGFSS